MFDEITPRIPYFWTVFTILYAIAVAAMVLLFQLPQTTFLLFGLIGGNITQFAVAEWTYLGVRR